MRREDSLADTWFQKPPSFAGRSPSPDTLAARPREAAAAVPARLGAPLRSAVAGAVAGCVGGVLALVSADAAISRARLALHVRILLGQAPSLGHATPTTTREVLGVAAVVGLVLGAVFGRLMRRLFPVLPRLVFGTVLSATSCTVLYAFVLLRYAPWLAGPIPFLPCLLGAVAYGLSIGVAPPIERSPLDPALWEPEEPPALPRPVVTLPTETGASFPLVRRRSIEPARETSFFPQ